MPIIETEFGAVDFLEYGEGDDLVLLLHAAATGAGSLAKLGQRLAQLTGARVVVPALSGYGESRVSGVENPIAGHLAIAGWALNLRPAARRFVFGQSMGGLIALRLAGLEDGGLAGLALYEPMVFDALDPNDDQDMAWRKWDRDLVETMKRALGTSEFEVAVSAFIEAWNEAPWHLLPEPAKREILKDPERLVAETMSVNVGGLDLDAIDCPLLLLGGGQSPELASRIIERLAQRFLKTVRRRFEGFGHMGPVRHPETIARCLCELWGLTADGGK